LVPFTHISEPEINTNERGCLTTGKSNSTPNPSRLPSFSGTVDVTRWDEKAGLRRDAVGSQVIDVLEAQEIKETGNEED
jgi:hypothetical protein